MRGLWARVRAAWQALIVGPAGGSIEVRRPIASIVITLSGNTVQTDMEVSVLLLEQLANGIGRTLVEMPSKERH